MILAMVYGLLFTLAPDKIPEFSIASIYILSYPVETVNNQTSLVIIFLSIADILGDLVG